MHLLNRRIPRVYTNRIKLKKLLYFNILRLIKHIFIKFNSHAYQVQNIIIS